MSSGSFRMLPAIEEKGEPSPQPATVEPRQAAPLQKEIKKPDNQTETAVYKAKVDTSRSAAAPARPKSPDLNRKPESATDNRKPVGSPVPPSASDIGSGIPKPKLPQSQPGIETSRLKEMKPVSTNADQDIAAKRLTKPTINSEKPAHAIPNTPPKSTGLTAFTHIVAVGTSTGGPRALHELLTGIPADFPAPILVVQHMPPKFTHSLAQRLDNFCSIQVREAVDGEPVETATAYIAPGGRHMTLAKEANGKYRIKLSDEGPRGGHMPSVDVMFESLIGQHQLKRHVVLMTGMGSDGAKGMKALQTDGAVTTIAEAEQTCVVYGMPRSAVELGAVSHLLPLQGIASVLVKEVKLRKP
ncbi:chemotaxis response regulator protein-glutamate methylesterase [Cohnella sp. NL03-T5]|nr:chemotaxis response regulator protein-glutamate methylesterase [Cohnella silvisoli]